MDWVALAIGFALGGFVTAGWAYFMLRRHLRIVRSAERRARQAERMAEIGAMTGGLAHEIKNPLSTIGLNAQLLVEAVTDLSIPEDDRSRLLSRARALQRETERLRGILTDFLEFAGQIHLDRRHIDLNGAVSELADFFLPEAASHGVRLRCDPAPSPVMVSADARLIKQALLNLMINAVQAMAASNESNGRGKDLILRIEAGKDAEGSRVGSVHVIDTGPGIPSETLREIFRPYFTTKSGGSGLGLPTSRRLIEEHGGRIQVHSEPGQGTDFTVSLPLDGTQES